MTVYVSTLLMKNNDCVWHTNSQEPRENHSSQLVVVFISSFFFFYMTGPTSFYRSALCHSWLWFDDKCLMSSCRTKNSPLKCWFMCVELTFLLLGSCVFTSGRGLSTGGVASERCRMFRFRINASRVRRSGDTIRTRTEGILVETKNKQTINVHQ